MSNVLDQPDSLELRQELNDVGKVMRDMVSTAETAKRDFSEKEMKQWEAHRKSYERLERQLERVELIEKGLHVYDDPADHEADDARWLAARNHGMATTIDVKDERTIESGLKQDESLEDRLSRKLSKEDREWQSRVSMADYLRAMHSGPRNQYEQRALSEGGTAGNTVAEVLFGRWIDQDLRNKVRTMQAGATSLFLDEAAPSWKVPKQLTDPTPAWRAESGAVAESDPTFTAVTIDPESCAVRFKVPVELLQDSPVLDGMLRTSLAEAFAVLIDGVVLAGSGSSNEPEGIRNYTNASEHSMGTNGAAISDYTPFTSILRKLQDNSATIPDNAAVVCAPRTVETLNNLVTGISSDLTPLTPPPAVSGWRFLETTGVSIAETQGTESAASSAYTGDWSKVIQVFRQNLTIKLVDQLYSENLQVGFLAFMRFDCVAWHEQHLGRIVGIAP